MPRVKPDPAEEVLIEFGAIKRPSLQRRELLGCLSCRWTDSLQSRGIKRAYGHQIVKCTGMTSAMVYTTLQNLEDAGAITIDTDPTDDVEDGRSLRRRYITPADTDIGNALMAVMQTPKECELPQ